MNIREKLNYYVKFATNIINIPCSSHKTFIKELTKFDIRFRYYDNTFSWNSGNESLFIDKRGGLITIDVNEQMIARYYLDCYNTSGIMTSIVLTVDDDDDLSPSNRIPEEELVYNTNVFLNRWGRL